MKRWLIPISVMTLLAFSLSCSKKKSTEPEPNPPPQMKTISLNLCSPTQAPTDTIQAQEAKNWISTMNGIITSFSAMAQAYSGMAGAGTYSDGHWRWTYTDGQATFTVTVTKTSDGYDWEWKVTGILGEETVDDWKAAEGHCNNDGTEGWVKIYEVNTTTVELSWKWEVSADSKSGHWWVYEGDMTSESLSWEAHWSTDSNGLLTCWMNSVDGEWKVLVACPQDGSGEFYLNYEGDYPTIESAELKVTWTEDGVHGQWWEPYPEGENGTW